jgi:hypothetical protein
MTTATALNLRLAPEDRAETSEVLKLLKCRNFRGNESEPEGTGVACHADEADVLVSIPHVILPDPHNGALKRLELKEK